MKGIVDRFPQMHTLVISESEAAIVQQRLEQLGFGDTADKIGVHGYSAVRNLGWSSRTTSVSIPSFHRTMK